MATRSGARSAGVHNTLLLAKHRMLNVLRATPSVWVPLRRLVRWLKRDPYYRALEPDTELVIEGFFRTANTFSKFAFLIAQTRDVKIAVHTHAPATVIRAVQWKIPTVVLIRNPLDTVASLLLKHPFITIRQGYRDYIAFYCHLMPYRHGYVVATFNQLTTNFGEVIARINRRFGTKFAVFEHTPENEAQVLAIIKEIDESAEDGDVLKYSVPLPMKRAKLRELKNQAGAPEFKDLLARAQAIYEDLRGSNSATAYSL